MLMPEATVDEDRLLLFWENDVRVARQVPAVQTVPITHAVQEAPNVQFRTHILAANATHVVTAALR